jgi:hypothetical protein
VPTAHYTFSDTWGRGHAILLDFFGGLGAETIILAFVVSQKFICFRKNGLQKPAKLTKIFVRRLENAKKGFFY